MLMSFDLLVDAKGRDLRAEPFDDRRDALEAFTGALGRLDLIGLSEIMRSIGTVRGWLKTAGQGLDGIVAKSGYLQYRRRDLSRRSRPCRAPAVEAL